MNQPFLEKTAFISQIDITVSTQIFIHTSVVGYFITLEPQDSIFEIKSAVG